MPVLNSGEADTSYLNKNTSGVKKVLPRTKKGLMCNQNGKPRLPAFDRITNFDHHDLTAKHCYFECSRSPDVDGNF